MLSRATVLSNKGPRETPLRVVVVSLCASLAGVFGLAIGSNPGNEFYSKGLLS